MWYEINVSRFGKHLFATHERSITSQGKAMEIKELFDEKFPASEGYHVTVTKWEKKGEFVEL